MNKASFDGSSHALAANCPLTGDSVGNAKTVAHDGPFELGELLARCVDDREFCALVLHKFSQRAADQMAAIDRAVANGNSAELAVRAHTLKGVAANLAAERLASAAAELERLARGPQLDRVTESVALVRGELERAVQFVPEVVEQLLAGR